MFLNGYMHIKNTFATYKIKAITQYTIFTVYDHARHFSLYKGYQLLVRITSNTYLINSFNHIVIYALIT